MPEWDVLSAAITNITTASDCQTPSGQIPGDEPEQGIDGYEGKHFEKISVENAVRYVNSRPGAEHDNGEMTIM